MLSLCVCCGSVSALSQGMARREAIENVTLVPRDCRGARELDETTSRAERGADGENRAALQKSRSGGALRRAQSDHHITIFYRHSHSAIDTVLAARARRRRSDTARRERRLGVLDACLGRDRRAARANGYKTAPLLSRAVLLSPHPPTYVVLRYRDCVQYSHL